MLKKMNVRNFPKVLKLALSTPLKERRLTSQKYRRQCTSKTCPRARGAKGMEQVGYTTPVDDTSGSCKRAMRDTLALLFTESYHFVRLQTEKMKQLKAELSSTKNQLIENQKWVISLQEQIIDSKDNQLDAVQTVVKSSVESNLKEQFKSYSEAAAENVMVCQADSLTDPATLKKVVKSVVQ